MPNLDHGNKGKTVSDELEKARFEEETKDRNREIKLKSAFGSPASPKYSQRGL